MLRKLKGEIDVYDRWGYITQPLAIVTISWWNEKPCSSLISPSLFISLLVFLLPLSFSPYFSQFLTSDGERDFLARPLHWYPSRLRIRLWIQSDSKRSRPLERATTLLAHQVSEVTLNLSSLAEELKRMQAAERRDHEKIKSLLLSLYSNLRAEAIRSFQSHSNAYYLTGNQSHRQINNVPLFIKIEENRIM